MKPTLGAEAALDATSRTIGATEPPAPREADALPTAIGRFRILQRLGVGGMGVVFAGYDVELDCKVAIKLLLMDRGEGSIGRTRLLREAQAMAKLSHPNVIPVYEVGTFAGQIYLAMEFVRADASRPGRVSVEGRGPSCSPCICRRRVGSRWPTPRASSIAYFKPENALVGADGRLRILDFGLATRGGLSEHSPAPDPAARLIRARSIRASRAWVSAMGTPTCPPRRPSAPRSTRAQRPVQPVCIVVGGAARRASVRRRLARGAEPEPHGRDHAHRRPAARICRAGCLHRALLRGLQTDPGGAGPTCRR